MLPDLEERWVSTFDSIRAWENENLAQQLDWYRQVACSERPAKALIASRISVNLSASETELWQEYDRVIGDFLALWERCRAEPLELPERASPNLLDLVVELSQRMLTHCNFCRWNCNVDRSTDGKRGACQLEVESRVSSYFAHRGEELVYRGVGGSGTIFFTSCNMRCSFCQNGDISTDKENGQVVSPQRIAEMARRLRLDGCHNINWVGGDPTIHLHNIMHAISLLPQQREGTGEAFYRGEFNVPMIWNSNFFMTPEAMKLLRVTMDAWLPDFKFGEGKCPVKLARTPWYWETVTANIKTISEWGENFTIRHLIMPNHLECCTFRVLEWVKEHTPEAPINVMDQYHPDTFCDPHTSRYQEKYAEISRRCTRDEIKSAYRRADELGLHFRGVTFEVF
jgi:putative pyruvate formate lyase activating enzyme